MSDQQHIMILLIYCFLFLLHPSSYHRSPSLLYIYIYELIKLTRSFYFDSFLLMIAFNFNYPTGYKAYAKKRKNYQQMAIPTPQLFIRRLSSPFGFPDPDKNTCGKINIYHQSEFQTQQIQNSHQFRTLQTRKNTSYRNIIKSPSQKPMTQQNINKMTISNQKIKPKVIYLRNKSKRSNSKSCQSERIVELSISKKLLDSRPASAQNYRYHTKNSDSFDFNSKKRYSPSAIEVFGKKLKRVQKKQSMLTPW